MNYRRLLRAALCAGVFLSAQMFAASIDSFFQTNLNSDLPGLAPNQDANLVNPWGIAFTNTSPIWISDNGAGVSTVYNGAGQAIQVMGHPLVVTIPPPAGGMPPATPTGVVANGDMSLFGGSHFIFVTEDGTVSAWSGGGAATLEVDNSPSGAVYKGVAIDGSLLYAANFNSGKVDVFNSSFMPATVSGGFTDPNLPSGFAPFDIQNINGLLYITYAKQDADKKDDVAGAGNGFVDVFDANGVLQKRLVSNGPLNSPWGLALAPAGFGPFGGDLLVGNFGDGTINAFDSTGSLVGTVDDAHGNPIVNQGLWGLAFGNGAFGTSPDTLYFTAGIPGPDGMVEDHGLFGDLQQVPEPGTILSLGIALCVMTALRRRRRA